MRAHGCRSSVSDDLRTMVISSAALEQADKDVAARLYEKHYQLIASTTTVLDFNGEMGRKRGGYASESLPPLNALTALDLSRNDFDDAAATALASGIGQMQSPKTSSSPGISTCAKRARMRSRRPCSAARAFTPSPRSQ